MRATAFVALFSSACALVTNLDGLGGGSSIDAGSDATDGASTTDASDASNDAHADAGPCAQSLLVGEDDLSGMGTDTITAGGLDLIRFTTTTPGVARCAWIYVPAVNTDVSSVYLAAYDLDNGGNPSKLLATATLPAPPTPGWNNAVLDSPLTLDAGESLWLGAVSPTGYLPVFDTNQCSSANSVREDHPVTMPPATFVQTSTFPPCSMGFYLGP